MFDGRRPHEVQKRRLLNLPLLKPTKLEGPFRPSSARIHFLIRFAVMVPQFSIRFSKSEVLNWANRYSYADDNEVEVIGARSRRAGFYTREDFLSVCEWKTRGRPRRHYRRNSEEDVRRQTEIALASADEKTRIMSLIELHGVSWPTASVILHLAHKEPYPILDFRALWSLQCERNYYSFAFWREYVHACRALAAECRVSMRDLDRALWQYSKDKEREQHCDRYN